jgi:ankyrin repeat protein
VCPTVKINPKLEFRVSPTVKINLKLEFRVSPTVKINPKLILVSCQRDSDGITFLHVAANRFNQIPD